MEAYPNLTMRLGGLGGVHHPASSVVCVSAVSVFGARVSEASPVPSQVRAGMSLVEVMIALAMLVTVIATLMGTIGSAASVNSTADQRERAVTSTQRLIEQIQAANSLYAISQSYANSSFDVQGLSPPTGRAHVGQTRIPTIYQVSAATTNPGPMPVLIEVRWQTATSTSDSFSISYVAVPR